jgi:L-iditol 2-dehydrogenase
MEGKMKAQVYYKPEDMKLEHVSVPKVNENQILIRVRACGVCGSDVAYYFGKSPLETPNGLGPLILGHEFAGDIVEMGRMAEESGLFAVGDRVLANPVQQCGVCQNCKRAEVNLCVKPRTKGVSTDGAFAEYTVMDMTHVYKIPDHISYEEAALCEPLACACYGVKKLDVQLGDFTVIYGPGAIGLMMLQLIKARGAGRVVMVGILDYGLKKALELGADAAFNTLDQTSPYYCADVTARVREMTDGAMARRVIVPTSAKPALQGALEVSGKRAKIVFFGLPGPDTVLEIPLLDFLTSDKAIDVSWLAPYTWDTAVQAMAERKIALAPLVTHRYPLEDLESAIRFMNDNTQPEKVKCVIQL